MEANDAALLPGLIGVPGSTVRSPWSVSVEMYSMTRRFPERPEESISAMEVPSQIEEGT